MAALLLLSLIPKAVLTSIIVMAALGLVDVNEVKDLKKVKRSDLVLLTLTFAATLGMGVVYGIGVGIVRSLAWMVYFTSRPHLAILGRVPGTQLFRNIARHREAITYEGILIVRDSSAEAAIITPNTNSMTSAG